MPLANQVSALATRVATEIKAVRTSLAGYVPTTRTISAGTGLSGGGDLSANRSLAVTYGATAGTAAVGNDSRLSDARTPTAHNHAAPEVSSGTLDIARLPVATSGTSSATQVVRANDTRLIRQKSYRYLFATGVTWTSVTAAYNAPQQLGTALTIPDPGVPFILRFDALLTWRNGATGQRIDFSVRLGASMAATEVLHLTGDAWPGGTYGQKTMVGVYPNDGTSLTGAQTVRLGAGMFPTPSSGEVATAPAGNAYDPGHGLTVTMIPV